MGLYKAPEICIFTGLPTENLNGSFDGMEYHITIDGHKHFIRLPYDATDWENNNPVYF
jgi:hypothetical protein